MRNLEQVRAKNALRCQQEDGRKIVGAQGGEVVKKVPPLIINHGLLATLAYAYGKNEEGLQLLFDHIARHLADPEVGIVPKDVTTHSQLMDYLTSAQGTSELLKFATLETMAWLTYARRFVRKN